MIDYKIITLAVVTVAFIALAGVLIVFSPDPNMQKLAVGIITGFIGLWVQSPLAMSKPPAMVNRPPSTP